MSYYEGFNYILFYKFKINSFEVIIKRDVKTGQVRVGLFSFLRPFVWMCGVCRSLSNGRVLHLYRFLSWSVPARQRSPIDYFHAYHLWTSVYQSCQWAASYPLSSLDFWDPHSGRFSPWLVPRVVDESSPVPFEHGCFCFFFFFDSKSSNYLREIITEYTPTFQILQMPFAFPWHRVMKFHNLFGLHRQYVF